GYATVISQLVSGILCLVYIVKRFDILHLKKSDLKPDSYYIGRLCAVGLPMGLQYSITAIGSILLQTEVNGLGSTYVAAVTAGSKVNQFMCCPFDAMGSTMATYGGQNIGAGRVDRVKKGLFSCSLLGVGYAVFAFGLVSLLGGKLAMLFIKADSGDPEEILSLAGQFMQIMVSFYVPLAFVNIVRFLIQGMGFSQIAVFAGVFEMVARAVMGLCFVPIFGYNAVCFASPSAWVLADMFLIPAFFLCFGRVKRKVEREQLSKC
ncbi:MAG: MATE family efflux transporter, partial [Oscillospiraceae bacterium]|nr:MATE family efflux transporter [Oscillospiraceae bacterium]